MEHGSMVVVADDLDVVVLRPFLDLLPDEILLQILTYLPLSHLALASPVLGSGRIRRLCRDPHLCRYIHIVPKNQWDRETARRVVVMAGSHVRRLTMAASDDDDASGDTAMAVRALEVSPRLEVFICDNAVLTSGVMEGIGKSTSLKQLRLTVGTAAGGSVLSTGTFISNASHLKNLTSLYFDAAGLDDDGADLVTHIADHCRSLESVGLPYSSSLNDEVFNYFLDKIRGTLRNLTVHGQLLTDASICNLKLCPLLRNLNLTNAKGLGREGLSSVTGLNLFILSITGTVEITGHDLAEVFTGSVVMENLHLLSLVGCSELDDASLGAVAARCPNLKMLYLNHCVQVGDAGVRSALGGCEKLKELWLSGTRVTPKAFVGCSARSLNLVVDVDLVEEVAKVMPPPHCQVGPLDAVQRATLRDRVVRLLYSSRHKSLRHKV